MRFRQLSQRSEYCLHLNPRLVTASQLSPVPMSLCMQLSQKNMHFSQVVKDAESAGVLSQVHHIPCFTKSGFTGLEQLR